MTSTAAPDTTESTFRHISLSHIHRLLTVERTRFVDERSFRRVRFVSLVFAFAFVMRQATAERLVDFRPLDLSLSIYLPIRLPTLSIRSRLPTDQRHTPRSTFTMSSPAIKLVDQRAHGADLRFRDRLRTRMSCLN